METRGSIATPEKRDPARWRQINTECRKRVKEEKKMNLGYSCKNYKGVEKPAKTLGEPCKCKRKCREKLMGKEKKIFHSFWDLQTHDQQNNYLFGRIQALPKKT